MDLRELHWLMNLLTHMDVGVTVFDLKGRVRLWNNFMENHSGVPSSDIMDRGSLFDLFPVFRQPWLQNKLQSALLLDHGAFISWEQYPHLFDFPAYRPVTGSGGKMYQNVSINALKDASGEASLISLVVYDVTNIALNRLSLEQANRELEDLSRSDRLTGLANRGFWQECLEDFFKLFQRYQTPCSLVMFDIDHFKCINDSHGHLAGDRVIQRVAKEAANAVRNCDMVGRYGGEEFGILLPETNLSGALTLAERLRQRVEAMCVEHNGHSLRCTISLGAVQLTDRYETQQAWIDAADAALYSAKQAGRNQTHSTG